MEEGGAAAADATINLAAEWEPLFYGGRRSFFSAGTIARRFVATDPTALSANSS